ncbi:C3HC zinc finger-like-domain-containing protein [Xylaria sp. CBS 124048]|nr:C3HC zinc finger-like-domain-containing protein [Xylaria sp. CBS 124048]
MNATKRKFNTLIQGIGVRQPQSPKEDAATITTRTPTRDEAPLPATFYESSPLSRSPSTLMAPPSPTVELLSKRRRVGVPDFSSPNQKPSITLVSEGGIKKWAPSKILSSAPKHNHVNTNTPRYCPSDREELIKRLGTFQELTEWTPKPDPVNEIEWAKRGWVCQGKERVRCTLCYKEVVVKMNTRTADGKQAPVVVGSDVEQGLTKRFSELIIEAHEEDCLWRRHGCDDSLLRLPLPVPQSALASLRERYDDLCTRSSFLPYIVNLRLPSTFDLEAVKSQLPPTFFTEPKPPGTNPATPNNVALALALLGWQGLTNPRIGAVPNSATCATCLRRLGLWMFRSKEIDEVTGEIIVPAPMDHLDPVREHRFFCPWRNPEAQQNPGAKTRDTKAAWEVLAQTLKNTSYLRQQAENSSSSPAVRRSFLHRSAASLPGTPARHRKQDSSDGPHTPGNDDEEDVEREGGEGEEEDMTARDAKDKERWAKLRRVKSLFDTKGRKKHLRTLSRPGTPNNNSSSSRPTTAHSRHESVDRQSEKKKA